MDPQRLFQAARWYQRQAQTEPSLHRRYLTKAYQLYLQLAGNIRCLPEDPPNFTPLGTMAEVGPPKRCNVGKKGSPCHRTRLGTRYPSRTDRLYRGRCSDTDIAKPEKQRQWRVFSGQLDEYHHRQRELQQQQWEEQQRLTRHQLREQLVQDSVPALQGLLHPQGDTDESPSYQITSDRVRLATNGQDHILRWFSHGSFGLLYHGTRTIQGETQPVAIKYLVDDPNVKEMYGLPTAVSTQRHIAQEILMMEEVADVPGVIKMYDRVQLMSPIWFQTPRSQIATLPPGYYIYQEFCPGGELLDLVTRSEYFTEKACRVIVHQLVTTMTECHHRGVVHRDLKLENILLATSGTGSQPVTTALRITDFGMAIHLKTGQRLSAKVGTPYYMPPELTKRNSRYTAKYDVWSLGVITYVLLYGVYPFQGRDREELTRQIYQQVWGTPVVDYSPRLAHRKPSPRVSEAGKQFLRSIFRLENRRPRMEQLLTDPWLQVSPAEQQGVIVHYQHDRPLYLSEPPVRQRGGEASASARRRVILLRQWLAHHRAQQLQQQLKLT